MLSMDISTNCAPNFIQNADILIGNTSAENKELECTITYNNIESSFLPTLGFFENLPQAIFPEYMIWVILSVK